MPWGRFVAVTRRWRIRASPLPREPKIKTPGGGWQRPFEITSVPHLVLRLLLHVALADLGRFLKTWVGPDDSEPDVQMSLGMFFDFPSCANGYSWIIQQYFNYHSGFLGVCHFGAHIKCDSRRHYAIELASRSTAEVVRESVGQFSSIQEILFCHFYDSDLAAYKALLES